MIHGVENDKLLLNILQKADLTLFEAQTLTGKSKLTESLRRQLISDPALIDKIISEGLSVNSGKITLIISVLYPAYFVSNLNKFQPSDFRAVLQDSPHKGISALWLLALSVDAAKVDVFTSILNHFKDHFSAADFTVGLQEGPHKGISALWLLSLAAGTASTEGLLAVLKHFKGQFTAENFTAVAKEGVNKGLSALWYIVLAANRGNSRPLMSVLAHIAFDCKTLNSVTNEKLSNETHNLLAARMKHVALLEMGSKDEHRLFLNTEAAKLAGYAESYYELGKYFETMNMPIQAVRSFLEIADDSYYVENICNEYFASYIGKATESVTDLEKLSYLDTALKIALKISCDEQRYASLQTIARIFINHTLRNGTDVGGATIPSHLIEVMHGQLDSSWCFKAFNEIAEKEKQKQSLNEKDQIILNLTKKLEKLKLKRTIEQETHQNILIPIKKLLTKFDEEKQKTTELQNVVNPLLNLDTQVRNQFQK